ncbi:MAG: DUF4402 domain-containing protein [Bacteroidia bacterium]|nr:DUF4402 domain-containing protein [Bacteroidia bacterium]
MTRSVKIFFSLVFSLFVALDLNAQTGTEISVTGHITAEIIPVFSASETSQMNFGKFSPGPRGGEIILTPQSTISVLGSVFAGNGLHNAASFYVSGNEDAAFSITLPSDPVVLTHASSAKTMIIEEWNTVPSPGTGTGMLQNGFQVVYVGATLKVGTLIDNPVGIYTGSYNITFDFN